MRCDASSAREPCLLNRFDNLAPARSSIRLGRLRFAQRRNYSGGGLWQSVSVTRILAAFEPTSKRRCGYPSETRVKRGTRIVHGDKELVEKLGRRDLCPCGSGRRFQEVLHATWALR